MHDLYFRSMWLDAVYSDRRGREGKFMKLFLRRRVEAKKKVYVPCPRPHVCLGTEHNTEQDNLKSRAGGDQFSSGEVTVRPFFAESAPPQWAFFIFRLFGCCFNKIWKKRASRCQRFIDCVGVGVEGRRSRLCLEIWKNVRVFEKKNLAELWARRNESSDDVRR